MCATCPLPKKNVFWASNIFVYVAAAVVALFQQEEHIMTSENRRLTMELDEFQHRPKMTKSQQMISTCAEVCLRRRRRRRHLLPAVKIKTDF